MPWSRRDLLGAGLVGAGWATLGGVPASARVEDELASAGDLAGKTLNLVLRYRTDPDRIARVLPPALEPDDVAEVTIDWWLHYPERGGENLFYPGPYTESGIHVTARWQGQRGMFQVGMPLDQDWGRVAGRENVGLLKKDGAPRISRQGRHVRADLTRRGKVLYRVETEVLDLPAHPLYWHRETGFGAFLYRYRLDPDWRRGPLGPDPVELWLRVLGGKRGVYPSEMVEGAPRQCDPARTRFELVEPSALDPFGEFPLQSIVGVSYRETGLFPEADKKHHEASTPTRIERLQYIDPKAFEPWAFSIYDRPITQGRAWVPVGWPERTTAIKVAPEEIERWRGREELASELHDLVEVDLRIAPEVHGRLLPPELAPGADPRVRILALDIGVSDLTTASFQELWLFALCRRDGHAAWYALSHLVGPDGDVVFGRETFGWPSRMASIEWRRDGESLSIEASRLGRRVARIGVAATTAVDAHEHAGSPRVEVVGLRLHPPYRVMAERGFVEPGPRAELVAQSWTFELAAAQTLEPSRVTLELPNEPGPGRIGKPDPWYELSGAEVVAVVTARGALRRAPGAVVGKLEPWEPYYAERWDGTLDAAKAISGDVGHTFLMRPAEPG